MNAQQAAEKYAQHNYEDTPYEAFIAGYEACQQAEVNKLVELLSKLKDELKLFYGKGKYDGDMRNLFTDISEALKPYIPSPETNKP